MIGRIVSIFVIVSVLTGCIANPFKKNEPLVEKQEVTIDAALQDIANGVINMKTTLDANKTFLGVYVDSIDVDLILDTTHDEKGNVKLGINPLDFTSLSKSSGNLSLEEYEQILDKRNSTVKIRFKSIYSSKGVQEAVGLDCNGKDKDKPKCKGILNNPPITQ